MEKVHVILEPLDHRGALRIAIKFPFHQAIKKAISTIPGAAWSQTNKCWHIPYTAENYRSLLHALKPIADISINQLEQYQKAEADNTKLQTIEVEHITKPTTRVNKIKNDSPLKKKNQRAPTLEANSHHLREITKILKLKSYSASTMRTYQNELSIFFSLLGSTDAATLSIKRIQDYIVYCLDVLKLTENTVHSRLNALKFFYEQVLGYDKFFAENPRPKKHVQLPRLLNETEIGKLFNALTNRKHKAILFTVYSAGLRVSEVVSLQLQDVDSKRMQVFIRKAKGKKDRYVNLSPVLLDILRQYINVYTPRPKQYLFESEQTGKAYPTRTVQQIFSNAKQKAGITKTVGIHSLRHSFATHLLDKGTDIKYIKDLLGHFDIRTTERYLHVAKKSLVNIVSPLDDLWKNENIEW